MTCVWFGLRLDERESTGRRTGQVTRLFGRSNGLNAIEADFPIFRLNDVPLAATHSGIYNCRLVFLFRRPLEIEQTVSYNLSKWKKQKKS